jgi:hypothetical protein
MTTRKCSRRRALPFLDSFMSSDSPRVERESFKPHEQLLTPRLCRKGFNVQPNWFPFKLRARKGREGLVEEEYERIWGAV